MSKIGRLVQRHGFDVLIVLGAGGGSYALVAAGYRVVRFTYDQIAYEPEYVVATEDGAIGYQGYVTELVPQYLGWADALFACGLRQDLHRIDAVLKRNHHRSRPDDRPDLLGGAWPSPLGWVLVGLTGLAVVVVDSVAKSRRPATSSGRLS